MSDSGVIEFVGQGTLFGSILIRAWHSSLGGVMPDQRRPLYAGSQKSPYQKIQLTEFDLILQRPDGSELGTVPFGSTLVLPYAQAQCLLGAINGGTALATFVETVPDPDPPAPADLRQIVGTVGGEPVTVTPGAQLNAPTQRVTIGGTDYIMGAPPPGWPGRPPAGIVYKYPRTITAGSTVELLQPEAAALVNAGFAT